MKLYHGSNILIQEIDLARSKPYKDFGQGFYLSSNREQALRMAEIRAYFTAEGEAVVTEFDFDESLLTDGSLNVKLFDDYSVEWAEFIIQNRSLEVQQPCHNYDIVYGPIADDGVGLQLKRYENGAISIEQLVAELKYAKGITYQYYFGTEKAISKLQIL